MGTLIVKAIILLLLPGAVFTGGATLIAKLSERKEITQQLGKLESKEDQKFLGLRICGYNAKAVARHWGALDEKALGLYRRSLEIDLLFPFFYGAAFAGALLCAWVAVGRPFPPAWLLAPVLIGVIADWVENLIQLAQLRLVSPGHPPALDAGWIQIASLATSVKLVLLFGVSSLMVIVMVGWMVLNAWPRSTAR